MLTSGVTWLTEHWARFEYHSLLLPAIIGVDIRFLQWELRNDTRKPKKGKRRGPSRICHVTYVFYSFSSSGHFLSSGKGGFPASWSCSISRYTGANMITPKNRGMPLSSHRNHNLGTGAWAIRYLHKELNWGKRLHIALELYPYWP